MLKMILIVTSKLSYVLFGWISIGCHSKCEYISIRKMPWKFPKSIYLYLLIIIFHFHFLFLLIIVDLKILAKMFHRQLATSSVFLSFYLKGTFLKNKNTI